MSKATRIRARHRATDRISHVSRHQETGRMRVPEWLQLFEEGFSGEPPDSHSGGTICGCANTENS